MSIQPIITFKAGKCDADFSVSPPLIKPVPTPGYLYLHNGDDDLVHFCWRPRAASLADPELDLVMIPTDGTFQPYLGPDKLPNKSPVKGRIFSLRFSSSSQRHFFWLQSREQPPGEPSRFSPRDIKLGQIVDDLLQGMEVDTSSEIATLRNQSSGGGDDDTTMEDAGAEHDGSHNQTGSGGADIGAADGNFHEEGEGPREGGADGGRASHSSDPSFQDQTSAAVQDFLRSLQGGQGSMHGDGGQPDKPFTTLADLLSSASTIPALDGFEPAFIEKLLVHHLPSALTFLEHGIDEAPEDADQETVETSVEALEPEQQKNIMRRVLRSPQFVQALMSLTAALRDGGLPMISEALSVPVENGGYTGPNRRTPMGGGAAVEAFLNGIKKQVEDGAGSTK